MLYHRHLPTLVYVNYGLGLPASWWCGHSLISRRPAGTSAVFFLDSRSLSPMVLKGGGREPVKPVRLRRENRYKARRSVVAAR